MNIKDARKNANMTQEDLADRIGVNRATLSKYENGQIEPSLSMIRKICEALNCHLGDIMTNEEMLGILQQSDSNFERAMEKKRKLDEKIKRESKRIDEEWKKDFNRRIKQFSSSTEGRTIISAFYDLNEYGQKEAVERIMELNFLPQFMKEIPEEYEDFVDSYLSERYSEMYSRSRPTEPPETPETDSESNSSSTDENPPEGL